jgi:hypothetical protein
MKQILKKYWWCFLFLLLLLLPFLLNWVVTRNTIMSYRVAGEPKDWISFWVTYLSAIASFMMVIFTWKMLRQNKMILLQNKQQLDQLKQQWKDDHIPEISVKIEKDPCGYYIVFKNIGKYIANNIKYNLNDDYISSITNVKLRKQIEEYSTQTFSLNPNERKSFFICPPDDSIPIYASQNQSGQNGDETITTNGIKLNLSESNEIYSVLKSKEIKINVHYADDVQILYKLDLKSYCEHKQDNLLLIAVALDRIQEKIGRICKN